MVVVVVWVGGVGGVILAFSTVTIFSEFHSEILYNVSATRPEYVRCSYFVKPDLLSLSHGGLQIYTQHTE